jgi:hypothetical protein
MFNITIPATIVQSYVFYIGVAVGFIFGFFVSRHAWKFIIDIVRPTVKAYSKNKEAKSRKQQQLLKLDTIKGLYKILPSGIFKTESKYLCPNCLSNITNSFEVAETSYGELIRCNICHRDINISKADFLYP